MRGAVDEEYCVSKSGLCFRIVATKLLYFKKRRKTTVIISLRWSKKKKKKVTFQEFHPTSKVRISNFLLGLQLAFVCTLQFFKVCNKVKTSQQKDTINFLYT